ncbi:nucleoside triphosphate pyrophosphohydrolase [bacterium]|nr:nucleoside triphosphate pyrophosphohydrolase [bacterium]
MKKAQRKFEELVKIMATLRSSNGCPWDREQDHSSLKPYLVEEVYEAIDAIDRGDYTHLKEELGDILLQIVFHAQIASEEKYFNIDNVISGIISKLERRHPHVFSTAEASTAEQVRIRWEEIKKEEKGREGTLDGVSQALPSLLFARGVQEKAAKVGFDWEDPHQVVEKVEEEIEELKTLKNRQKITEEIGDLLFSIVNLTRHLKVDPELSLRSAAKKFIKRFNHMENLAAEQGKRIEEFTLQEKDKLWEEAKKIYA